VRISRTSALVAVAFAIAFIGMWQLFARTEAGRFEAARKVALSRSEIHITLTIAHQTGAIARESYAIGDIDGLSTVTYSATNQNGTTVHVTAPARKTREYGSDVAYLFGQVVQDGIWDLTDKPPRGDTSSQYTVSVWQLVDGQHGSHQFTFTDPHYWATTGGHQFHIKLDRNKPVPDLLQIKSTVTVEPRYGKVIDDIVTFGSPDFRKTVAAQRARLAARR
jgi:hypothetical protein